MALRLPKAVLPPELRENMVRQLGTVPENVEVLWHSPQVASDNLEFGAKVGAWNDADPVLKSLAHMAVACMVGCSWCLDVATLRATVTNGDFVDYWHYHQQQEHHRTYPATAKPTPLNLAA